MKPRPAAGGGGRGPGSGREIPSVGAGLRRPRGGPRATGRGPPRGTEAVWVGGRRTVAEAIRAGVAREILLLEPVRGGGPLAGIAELAARTGVPTRPADHERLDSLVSDHKGVAARVALPRALAEPDLARIEVADTDIAVVLDGIMDPQNLGAAARAAEGAGATLLVTRERRSAPVTAAAVRASAGALLHLRHARVTNLTRTVELLKDRGFTVIGLDEGADRTVYDEPCPEGPVALVLGSEGEGISRLVREHCDLLVALPMRGRVESLNASSALAAVLFAYVVPSRMPSATI